MFYINKVASIGLPRLLVINFITKNPSVEGLECYANIFKGLNFDELQDCLT